MLLDSSVVVVITAVSQARGRDRGFALERRRRGLTVDIQPGGAVDERADGASSL